MKVFHYFSLLLILLLCPAYKPQQIPVRPSRVFTQLPTPQGNGVFGGLWNSFQLGVKNFIDQLVPNVQLPMILPQGMDDIQLENIEIPSMLGSGTISISGCPNCENLEPLKLTGLWHLVYANDNFIKGQLNSLRQVYEGLGLNPGGLVPSNIPFVRGSGQTWQDLFNPVRFPTCGKLLVGEPISYGFLADFPMQFSFHEGRPTGKFVGLPGNLRQVGQGRYVMIFAGGAYYIRLCMVDANFITKEEARDLLPNILNPNQPNLAELMNDTLQQQEEVVKQPLYMVLSDTGGFPACQNFAVFTTNITAFFESFDLKVLRFIAREAGDNNANPLLYMGCPQMYENML